MNQPLISVIIPVYNVEDYLRQCLDSVINQTYKNLEIIVVDDGSTDNSGKICDEYANRDSRIRVVHKENGGLSDARNAGLDICTGEYIGFVDSDDWIAEKLFESTYRVINEERADMCFFHSAYVYDGVVKQLKYDEYRVFTEKEAMIEQLMSGKGQTVAVCLKLYQKNVFNNIRFPVGKTNEDALVILDIIEAVTRMVMIPDVLYYYRQRNGSITRTKKWNRNIFDTVYAYKHNMEAIKKCCPNMIPVVEKRLFWAYRTSLALAAGVSDYEEHHDEVKKIKKEFRGLWLKILFNKYVSLKNIIDSYVAMLLPCKLYAKLRNYYLG